MFLISVQPLIKRSFYSSLILGLFTLLQFQESSNQREITNDLINCTFIQQKHAKNCAAQSTNF